MKKPNQDLEKLYKAASNDPSIKDPSKILFSIDKKGPLLNRQQVLVIEGRVADNNKFQKIEHIIEDLKLEYEIINNLKLTALKI
jgi:hypothetical protein